VKEFTSGTAGRFLERDGGVAEGTTALSASDEQRLVALLRQGPERLGYETLLWTCERVAHLAALAIRAGQSQRLWR